MDGTEHRFAPVIAGRRRVLACHSAAVSGEFPPNSLAAVEECVTERVPRLEIDVRFTADDAMVVFHDDRLDADSTGSGSVARLSRDELSEVRYRRDQRHALCFLEEVVDQLRGSSTILQVDLKLMRPMSGWRARRLAQAIAPLGEMAIVGSQAHWNLRGLGSLPVALDPTLQFHRSPGRQAGLIPARQGLHGMWDDASYAHNANFGPLEYITTRLEDAWALLPSAREWMVDIATVEHIALLGIDLGWWLLARGCDLAAWTFRSETPDRAALAARMCELGATTLITDCPEQLAMDLDAVVAV